MILSPTKLIYGMTTSQLPFLRDNFRIADMQYPQSGMYTLQYVAPQLIDTTESVAYTEGEMMTVNFGNYTVERKVVKYEN